MYKVFPIMLSAIVYVLGNNVREVGKTRAGRLYILEFLGLSNSLKKWNKVTVKLIDI